MIYLCRAPEEAVRGNLGLDLVLEAFCFLGLVIAVLGCNILCGLFIQNIKSQKIIDNYHLSLNLDIFAFFKSPTKDTASLVFKIIYLLS